MPLPADHNRVIWVPKKKKNKLRNCSKWAKREAEYRKMREVEAAMSGGVAVVSCGRGVGISENAFPA